MLLTQSSAWSSHVIHSFPDPPLRSTYSRTSCATCPPRAVDHAPGPPFTATDAGPPREHAPSSVLAYLDPSAADEATSRRMMRADLEHASSCPLPARFAFVLPVRHATPGSLNFKKTEPAMGLSFISQPCPRSAKRGRAVADVDGEHSCVQKKKRRLRLFLITSRLSPQFSHPASNIVDRGNSKIAVWAKQKALGRNLLRKAAILNRLRRGAMSARGAEAGHGRVLVEQEREQEQLALARLEFNNSSADTYTRSTVLRSPSGSPPTTSRTGDSILLSPPNSSPLSSPPSSRSPSPTPPSPPLSALPEESNTYRSPNEAYAFSPPRGPHQRRDYLPLPPSPLGISNYDAFDVDDEVPNPYSHLDDDEDPYTDSHDALLSFRTPSPLALLSAATSSPVLSPDEPVLGDYDQVDSGADAIWPATSSSIAISATPSLTSQTPVPLTPSAPASSHLSLSSTLPYSDSTTDRPPSPNFAILFAPPPVTIEAAAPGKRADSFAVSDMARPQLTLAPASASPNFAAAEEGFDGGAEEGGEYMEGIDDGLVEADGVSGVRVDVGGFGKGVVGRLRRRERRASFPLLDSVGDGEGNGKKQEKRKEGEGKRKSGRKSGVWRSLGG